MQAWQVRKLRAALSDDEPVSEKLLYERLARSPNAIARDDAERLIGEAQSANAIRWVAPQGWMWGGRPH
jgi:hypothetical protein